jgi:hypothetical protein
MSSIMSRVSALFVLIKAPHSLVVKQASGIEETASGRFHPARLPRLPALNDDMPIP